MSAHQFREDGSHYNGGKEFFGYGYIAIGEPRLKMVRRWYRQGAQAGKTEDRFFVDGEQVQTYEAALIALKTPPVVTDDERAKLTEFSELPEPFDIRGGDEANYRLSRALREKGFLKAWMGKATITETGRAAINPNPEAKS